MSLRQQVLQAELERIEAEAKTKSFLVMSKADDLAAAHAFCARLNAEVGRPWQHCHPVVVYRPALDSCEVMVFPPDHGEFAERCRELGVSLRETTSRCGPTVLRRAAVDELPGVLFLLEGFLEEEAA
jgi:hypothetical protein